MRAFFAGAHSSYLKLHTAVLVYVYITYEETLRHREFERFPSEIKLSEILSALIKVMKTMAVAQNTVR